MTDESSTAPRHPIQVASRRTGLSQDLIRAWERRHAAVSPERTSTNRRLYSDADIHRLRLLHGAIAGGRRIGDVAGLSLAELERLVSSDAEGSAPRSSPARAAPAPAAARHLARAVHAVEALDGDRLERELSEAAVDLPTPQLLERVLAPLLRSIGDGWREGRIRPSHEHLTTAVVRSFLGVIALRRDSAGTGGELVVATPAGQLHELGALMAAVAAVLDGWRVTYLGPNLAADEIALAARQRGARAVALSVIYAGDPNRIEAELRELRRLIGADIGLFVGGAGLAAVTGALAEVGALRIDSIDSFRRVLERLRGKTT